ncbi:MAG: CoA pyrophosphatase [Xanthomonadales bacterium]|nr:CoA pyrophosphatase [Xanthomonadales bacterium]
MTAPFFIHAMNSTNVTSIASGRRDDWLARLESAVSPLQEGVASLTITNFRVSDETVERPGRTAAVLVPVLDQPNPEVVLTRRAQHLNNHAGQISFPGGAAEKGDPSAVSTALREAHEEIGLEPGRVRPLGFLDRFDSVSDYRVLPVVGLVQAPVEWTLDPNEVEEVFTIPLDVVLEAERYERHFAVRDGIRFMYHSLEWQGHTIWGLTAAMLMNLQLRISDAD